MLHLFYFLICINSYSSESFLRFAIISFLKLFGVVPLICLKNLQKFCDEESPIRDAICSPSNSVKRK